MVQGFYYYRPMKPSSCFSCWWNSMDRSANRMTTVCDRKTACIRYTISGFFGHILEKACRIGYNESGCRTGGFEPVRKVGKDLRKG